MNVKEYFRDSALNLPVKHELYAPLVAIAVYLLMSLSGPIYRAIAPDGRNIYLVVSVIELTAIALPCLVFLRFRGGGERDAMGLCAPAGECVIFLLLATLAMLAGSIALSAAGTQLGVIRSSGYSLYESYGLPSGTSSDTALAVLTFALIPALVEEFLCRGILMSEYSKSGVGTSLFMSALFFAMLHYNFGKFPIYFFCGLMLGFIRLLTRSLAASFLAHLIYNLFGVFGQGFFSKVTEQLSEFSLVFFVSLGVFLLFAFFMFSEADRICHRYAERGAPTPFGATDAPAATGPLLSRWRARLTDGVRRLGGVLLSPTFLFAVLLYILITVIV